MKVLYSIWPDLGRTLPKSNLCARRNWRWNVRRYSLRSKKQSSKILSSSAAEETGMKRQTTRTKINRPVKQRFPPGWNQKRVQKLIAYYDTQTEDQELAEYEAAMRVNGRSLLLVPTELVPEIRRFIRDRRDH